MTTIPPGAPLPSRRELRERERAGQTGPTALPPQGAEAPPALVVPPAPAPGSGSSFAPEAPPAYARPATTGPVSTGPVDTGDRQLTRRELRALREAQGLVDPGEEPPPGLDPLTEAQRGRRAPESFPSAPVREPTPAESLAPPPVVPPPAPAPPVAEPEMPVLPPLPPIEQAEPVLEPPSALTAPPQAEEPARPVESVSGVAPEADGEARPPALVEPPTGWSPVPAGHWSRQAEAEEQLDTGGVAVTPREFGAPTTVTNALIVVPSATPPTADAPMSGDGEVLLTGSIALPDEFAATGLTGQEVETGDLDQLLDPGDVQLPDTHSQPVRASHAVSIHTETSGSMSLAPQRGGKGLAALIIVAGGMAVLVFGILVLAISTGQL